MTHGILIVDKPDGLTSARVVAKIKRQFKLRKVGHTGTLDPMATGVLPIAINEGTKIARFLLESDKDYIATARLGLTTDTEDITGNVLNRRDVPGLTLDQLESTLVRFRGAIEQIPPMFSALKHQGQRLYKLAREGQTVDRPPRHVTISRLEIIELGREQFSFSVRCSKGTYIRSLIRDIGEALGCGATMSALRRASAGGFLLDDAIALDALLQSPSISPHLVGLNDALRHLPAWSADPSQSVEIRHGRAQIVERTEISVSAEMENMIRIVNPEGHLLAIGNIMAEGDFQYRVSIVRGFNL